MDIIELRFRQVELDISYLANKLTILENMFRSQYQTLPMSTMGPVNCNFFNNNNQNSATMMMQQQQSCTPPSSANPLQVSMLSQRLSSLETTIRGIMSKKQSDHIDDNTTKHNVEQRQQLGLSMSSSSIVSLDSQTSGAHTNQTGNNLSHHQNQHPFLSKQTTLGVQIQEEATLVTTKSDHPNKLELFKKLREICNKLNVSNFGKLSDDFVALLGSQYKIEEDEQDVHSIVEFIFDRAVSEVDSPSAPKCYAELMAKVVKNESTVGKIRAVFLNKLQESSSKQFLELLKQKDSSNISVNEDQETANLKRRARGILRFIGELYLVDIISLPDIKRFANYLLICQTEIALGHLCQLLKIVGGKLELEVQNPSSSSLQWFESVFATLVAKMDSFSSKTKFAIMDILELRQKQWNMSGHNKYNNNVQDASSWRVQTQLQTQAQPASFTPSSCKAPQYSKSTDNNITIDPRQNLTHQYSPQAANSSSLFVTPGIGITTTTTAAAEIWLIPPTSSPGTLKVLGMTVDGILNNFFKSAPKTKKERQLWVHRNFSASLTSRTKCATVVTEMSRAAVGWTEKKKIMLAGAFLEALHRSDCISKDRLIMAFRHAFTSEVRRRQEEDKVEIPTQLLQNIGTLLTECFVKENNLDWLVTMLKIQEPVGAPSPGQQEMSAKKLAILQLIFDHTVLAIKSTKGEPAYAKLLDKTLKKQS